MSIASDSSNSDTDAKQSAASMTLKIMRGNVITMSIVNDADYSSRLNTDITTTTPPVNTLAGKLLSRKRKRDGDDPPAKAPCQAAKPPPRGSISLQQSFPESWLPPTVYPHARPPQTFVVRSVDNDRPLSFRILKSLPRAALPLSYIDNADSSTTLFTARLPQLDHAGPPFPPVLIACLDTPSQVLHAVERVGEKRYALCRLAAWLKHHHIDSLLVPPQATPQSLRARPVHSPHHPWWQAAALEGPVSSSAPSRKAPRLSLCRVDSHLVEPLPLSNPHPAPLPIDQSIPTEDTCQTIEDVLSRFIAQYLDTLYLSKTPLAFFAKGPLSRLRATFTSGQLEGTSWSALTQFLRNLLLSSSTSDKKYRDKLPELLKELPSQLPDQHHTPAAKKKRRKKKLKPDKCGLLPEETDSFAKWWYQDESSAPSAETAEQTLKRRIPSLRTRETFMQVVLALEILSLEALPDFAPLQDEVPQPKSKKGDTAVLSLELLVDKLCIWHSLHTVDLLGDGVKAGKTAKDGANQLSDFCVDVIIPFYMSRTYEHASAVNKKLGGPGASTNTKPKPSRKHSEVDVTATVEMKARRTLARVATDSLPLPAKTPRPFSRSATDSQVVPIKRETSAISLSSIHIRRDSQPALARKSEVLERHRLRQREVDFGALAAANEAKARKKQEVEQKLKDAISTLKKPSRATVSGEFVDAVEQRKRMAEGRARPPLSKRKSSSMAQVAATPKNGHKNSAITATPHRIPGPSFVQPSVSSSGPSMVPSSNIKQKSLSFAYFSPVNEASDDDDYDAIPATDHRPRHKNALAETPLKPRVGFADLAPADSDDEEEISRFIGNDRGDSSPLRESPTLLKTPSKPQRPRFSITPSKPTPPLNFGKGKAEENVAATPIKIAPPVAQRNEHAGREGRIGQRSHEEEESKDQPGDIYAALGWDDDLDDD
ncbi:hypothetical protein E4T43_00008 [Aureobasidium subglaciale]|nr:hypothetical protein E4T43_00008 [Aureobasidium subglaciale]